MLWKETIRTTSSLSFKAICLFWYSISSVMTLQAKLWLITISLAYLKFQTRKILGENKMSGI